MNKKFAILALLAFIAIVPFGAAAEPSLNLRAFSDEACPTSSAKYAVDITNPGNAQDTYTVSVDKPWSTVAPSTVQVAGGDTETAFVWLQPPQNMQPGTYNFEVRVASSNTGETTTATGTLEVLSCRNVELSVDQPSQNVCRGETATYNVQVTNEGRAEETYTLSASAGALSQNQVTLAPGESTTVQLSALSDREASRTLTVTAESTTSFASDSIDVEFTAEKCKSVDLFLTPSEKTVCEEEPAEYKITVQNTGRVQDTYSLSTNVESARVPDITLDPDESRTFSVTVREDEGMHTIVARVQSQSFSSVTRSEDATLNVENCYDLIIGAPENNSIQIDRLNKTLLEFGLYNNGTRTNNFELTFDGPEWADLRPLDAELRPEESERVFLYVAPDFFAERGTYTSKVSITGEGGIDRVLDITLTVGNETIVAEPSGQDTDLNETGTGFTGQIVSRAGSLAAIILVLAALFLGGYYLFNQRWAMEEEEAEAEEEDEDEDDTASEVKAAVTGAVSGTATRDYYKSANDFLDRNRNTVAKSLREDDYSRRFLEVLLEEERQDKHRDTVIEEIQRQLDKKERNGQ